MTTAQTTQSISPAPLQDLSQTLEQEAGELQSLHTGLRRHLTVWREAHETAILRLSAVMARMDAIMERIETNRA